MRKKKGWTQDEMYDRCGIHRATWSNYENGKTEPDIATLVKISNIFGTTIDDLLLKNFADVHLNEKNEGSKNQKNVHLSVHPTVQVNSKKEGYLQSEEPPQSMVKEEDSLSTWVVLGQLKKIDEKLDQLLLSSPKQPPNSG